MISCLRRSAVSSSANSVRRHGYTLIEMLIAVGLVVVLMSAVWELVSLYSTLQTAGVEATSEQQLVRSVMQLMHNDLTRVPLPAADDSPEFSDPFAVFDQTATVLGSDSIDFDTDLFGDQLNRDPLTSGGSGVPAAVSLQGTADVIRITIPAVAGPVRSVPDPDQLNPQDLSAVESRLSLTDGVAPEVDEFQTIVYQLQQFGPSADGQLPFGFYRVQVSAARLQSTLDRSSRREQDSQPGEMRLSRDVIEQLLFPATDELSEQPVSGAGNVSCDLIPDVVGCRFEYRAPDSWQSAWNSEEEGGLPTAIRITLDIVSTGELDQLRAVSAAEAPPGRLERRLYRGLPRTVTPAGQNPAEQDPRNLQIAPRSYTTLVLLDSTVEIGAEDVVGITAPGGGLP